MVNSMVAANIKRLREDGKLSLDALARLSGVSKSMLAQIERGEGNPTLSTMVKIANGLAVPFDYLISRPKDNYELVRTKDGLPILESEGKVRYYPIFPSEENRRFTIFFLEIDPDGHWVSDGHPSSTVEFVVMSRGQVTIKWQEEEHTIVKGENLRFPGDQVHSYYNKGDETAEMTMILFNPYRQP